MPWQAAYPTPQHEAAAEAIVGHFRARPAVASVLLVNSCARGRATADSCLDLAVVLEPKTPASERAELEASWEAYQHQSAAVRRLHGAGRFSVVHLDIVDGVFVAEERDEAAGPDGFELGIGNLLVYSHTLLERGDYLAQLRHRWLPYYDEALRLRRLDMVRGYCINNLQHIPGFVARQLYFQAFDRLYNAYCEFLQALFIARRTYPVAYNKWIREQVEEILGLPELYALLPHLFEIGRFESDELIEKARTVEGLLETYAPAPKA
jgi:predicted nucleotidyltransferase